MGLGDTEGYMPSCWCAEVPDVSLTDDIYTSAGNVTGFVYT